MGLRRHGLVLAGLLIITLVCIAVPVSAAVHTLNPGDSIRQAVTDALPGDTIVLNPGTYNEYNITLDKDITIRANTAAGGNAGNTIIDAGSAGSIFNKTSGHAITIDSLGLRNGYFSRDTMELGAGVVAVEGGSLTLTSSVITNCSSELVGGAILTQGSTVTITGTRFTNCSALYGGAIFSGLENPSTITITGSEFTHCVGAYAGAIFSGDRGGRMTITSTTFSNCSAGFGGAILAGLFGNQRSLTISSSTFSNCTAAEAGAVYSSSDNTIITSTTFRNCSAVAGGALVSTGNTRISGSVFTDCLAGDVHLSLDFMRPSDTDAASRVFGDRAVPATFPDSDLMPVTASDGERPEYLGGAIAVGGETFTLDSTTISNCTAGNGGAIFIVMASARLSDSTITNCSADYGGAIDVVMGDVVASNLTITDCQADVGGGILAEAGSTGVVTSTTFSRCQAYIGAAVAAADSSPLLSSYPGDTMDGDDPAYRSPSTITITSSTFTGCTAGFFGGAIANDRSTVTATSSTFRDCRAMFGGAAYADGGTTTVSGSTVENCMAMMGGAIVASGEGADILSGEDLPVPDSARSVFGRDSGGRDVPLYGNLSISDTRFTDCFGIGGGAIASHYANLNITTSSFSNCSATETGGAVYSDGSTTVIDRSSFEDCRIVERPESEDASRTFGDGDTGGAGGAISADYGTLIVTSSSFTSCTADTGGAIYADDGTLRITGSSFTGCLGGLGGAVFANDHTAIITSSTFTNCSTALPGRSREGAREFSDGINRGAGGAVFFDGDDLIIGSSEFSGCSAESRGAALSTSNGNTTITSTVFTDCRITRGTETSSTPREGADGRPSSDGGAVYSSGETLTVTSSSFSGCTAVSGGAVANDDGAAVIRFSRIYQCGPGAALWNLEGHGTVDAAHNWWGSNAEPSGFVNGTLNYTPWLVLSGSASPGSIATTWHSDIGADLTLDSTGTDTSAGGVYLPDGIPGTFAIRSGSGSLSPGTAGTLDGVASTRFLPAAPAHTNISATVDDQTVYIDLVVGDASRFTPASTGSDDGMPSGTPAPGSPSTGSSFPLMTVTVNIGGNSAAGSTTVTGTQLSGLVVTGTLQNSPGGNLTAPPGTVFQYFSLVPARFTTITSAAINFTVPQSWLDEHHIPPANIVLYHQTASGWVALPTTVLYTKDGTVFCTARSGGFSIFAIAGNPGSSPAPVTTVTLPEPASTPKEQAPVAAVAGQEPVTTQTTAPPAATTVPKSASPLLTNIVLVIAAIGVLGTGGFMARRWWIHRQNPALFEEFD